MCGPQLSGEMAFALYAEGRACPAPTWRQECGVIAAARAAWRLPSGSAEGSRPLPTEPEESAGKAKKLPADSGRGAQGCLPENYTRVFRTSCAGTGASMGRGVPSTHWMAFLGHLLTQVPQPLHLV